MMTDNAIEIKGLSKTFRKGLNTFTALKDVNFSVKKGEAFGFVGANGAGKSTTIKIMLDLIKADTGTVVINGVDSRNPISRKGLAFMPENPYLSEYLTPMEILRLGVSQHQVKVDDVDGYCMDWLTKLGMDKAANKKIRQMSKGMMQRTGLAHCLACQPEVLILDEPLSGLDPVGRVEVVDLFAEYHQAGGTLLFTSHVLHDVERIADRFAIIDKGLITSIKTIEDLMQENNICRVTVLSEKLPENYTAIGSNRAYVDVPKDQVWRELDKIKQLGLQLISVVPQLNLESLVVRHDE